MANQKKITPEVEQDAFVDSATQILDFLQKYSKIITFVVSAIVIAFVGFSIYTQSQKDRRAKASVLLSEAIEKFETAETDLLNSEKNADLATVFKTAETAFKSILEQYPNSIFTDQARFSIAKIKFYEKDYESAKSAFKDLAQTHRSENALIAIYAQKAIGACDEQLKNYESAISAYDLKNYQSFQISENLKAFVIADSQIAQARCYEKLDRTDDALKIYNSIIDQFDKNLEKAIENKSVELILSAKAILENLSDSTIVVDNGSEDHFSQFKKYAEKIHEYKIEKEISDGLAKEDATAIKNFETESDQFLDNLKKARENRDKDQYSSALSYFGLAVELDFAPGRSIYEKALFNRDLLEFNNR